jgi:hypothetical protein
VAGCCECGDEPSGSCATELVSYKIFTLILNKQVRNRKNNTSKLNSYGNYSDDDADDDNK